MSSRTRTSRFNRGRLISKACLLAAPFVVAAPAVAAPIYIGDAAFQGLAVSSNGGTQADTLNPLTYAFTAPANVYTAPSAQSVTLTEVNFISDEGGGTLKPFVAKYNGGNNQQGASYTVLSIGDPITPPAGAFGGGGTLVNAQFKVGGVNPSVSLNAGDVLVAGFEQSSRIVLVGTGTTGVADYIANADTVPASTGQPLSGNGGFAFDRTMSFNVGLNVPEPSAAAAAGVAGLLVLGRRTRKIGRLSSRTAVTR